MFPHKFVKGAVPSLTLGAAGHPPSSPPAPPAPEGSRGGRRRRWLSSTRFYPIYKAEHRRTLRSNSIYHIQSCWVVNREGDGEGTLPFLLLLIYNKFWYGVGSCYPRGAAGGTSRPCGALRVVGVAAPTPEKAGRG